MNFSEKPVPLFGIVLTMAEAENDMSKRWWLGAVVAALPCVALAQDYPSRPVSMVVAAAAGGPIDVFTRIMAERISPILGQRVVVENVGGGGGATSELIN